MPVKCLVSLGCSECLVAHYCMNRQSSSESIRCLYWFMKCADSSLFNNSANNFNQRSIAQQRVQLKLKIYLIEMSLGVEHRKWDFL
jgi:hypothetical protein